MRKISVMAILISLILISISVSAVASEEQMIVPMGDIVLEPLAMKAKRPAVTFPHAVHFDYACQACHHKWSGEEPIVGCSTADCHDLVELPKNDAGQPVQEKSIAIRYYKNAYHEMCIGCHKEIKIKNRKMETSGMPVGEKLTSPGPTGCTECHKPE
jgi:hypothetical protein